MSEHSALNNALLQHFGRALDLVALKVLIKAQARVSIPNINILLGIQPKLDSYERVLMLYGFFNSCKTLDGKTARLEMFLLCMGLVTESARKMKEEENDYLFLLSLENMISYFKFYGVEENFERLNVVWSIINLHIESPISGVRDKLLTMFAKIVKNTNYALQVILPELLQRPWTDRNKFYLLAELFHEHKFLQIQEMNFSNLGDNFFKGLCMSLRYRHLFSPGQTLVKELIKQEMPQMYYSIADIFIFGSLLEKKVMIEHWSCLWNQADRDNIFIQMDTKCDFEAIIQTARIELDIFSHLVILRNIFSKQFQHRGFDVQAIDQIINDKWTIMSDHHFIEAQIYEIFVENVNTGVDTSESLKFLENFIESRCETADAAFRMNILKKLPSFLLHLAKLASKDRSVDNFFEFLRDKVFLQGVSSTIYQRQIFALKVLQTVLTLFVKNHPNDSHDSVVIQKIWDVRDNRSRQLLLHLASHSDFDDVRTLAYELLSKYLPGPTELINENVYQLRYPNFQTRFSIFNEYKAGNIDALKQIFKQGLDVTEESLRHMRKDPLHAVKNEVNLFKPLDCLNEFLIHDGISLESLENDGELIELVKCVSDVIIDLINSKEQGIDFSKLDENLLLLVEQSSVKSSHVEKDKKLLLQSFWQTLRVSFYLPFIDAFSFILSQTS